jgi:hypothetical protein
LIVDLCPPAARGRSVGVYYLARGLTVFPASFAGGWLWAIDPSYPFYAAFAIGVVGVVAYGIWGADDGAIRSSE